MTQGARAPPARPAQGPYYHRPHHHTTNHHTLLVVSCVFHLSCSHPSPIQKPVHAIVVVSLTVVPPLCSVCTRAARCQTPAWRAQSDVGLTSRSYIAPRPMAGIGIGRASC
jgi:hypothetical protein